jgi:glutamyl-tRNA synthetase
VVGNVTRELTDREKLDPDFVIVRSDGQPVFHLVNVIDDLEMGITHVIRGEDHLSNTAKHIALFRAFGVEPPKYAHIPLILNIDGTKMSKRDKGASLMTYLDEGYAPEAVTNYLCLLGWSPKGNREKVPIKEVIELFDLPHILRHNARFDLNKLHWLNGEYIREMDSDRFHELAVHALARVGIDTNAYELDYVKAALDTCKAKVKLFSEVPAFGGFYFKDKIEYDRATVKTDFPPENKPHLKALREALALLDDFGSDTLNKTVKGVAGQTGASISTLVHPLRVACTGRAVGPSLYHLMEVLGKERVVARLDGAMNFMD